MGEEEEEEERRVAHAYAHLPPPSLYIISLSLHTTTLIYFKKDHLFVLRV